jgi:hypothetical protein
MKEKKGRQRERSREEMRGGRKRGREEEKERKSNHDCWNTTAEQDPEWSVYTCP